MRHRRHRHQLPRIIEDMTLPRKTNSTRKPRRPSRKQAEEAVKTLLLWAGEDTRREGLLETPKRVAKAYEDWFSGYKEDPVEYLARTFEEVEGYDEMIVLRDIAFESHCEHHMAPIIGVAHVGYLPKNKVVGISKLARVVEAFARRFQVQEKMTAQIANCIRMCCSRKASRVVIEASHQCMTTRGIHKTGVSMVTSQMLGAFRNDARTRAEFLRMIDKKQLAPDRSVADMKKLFLSCAALLLAAVLYLALWPVPIEPVSWQAPRSNGLVDPFAPDAQLRFATGIPLGNYSSPEDAVPGDDGKLYVTTEEGMLLQIDKRGTIVEFAELGGGRWASCRIRMAPFWLPMRRLGYNGSRRMARCNYCCRKSTASGWCAQITSRWRATAGSTSASAAANSAWTDSAAMSPVGWT